eukprot:1048553-Amphidinium_carterae.1
MHKPDLSCQDSIRQARQSRRRIHTQTATTGAEQRLGHALPTQTGYTDVCPTTKGIEQVRKH